MDISIKVLEVGRRILAFIPPVNVAQSGPSYTGACLIPNSKNLYFLYRFTGPHMPREVLLFVLSLTKVQNNLIYEKVSTLNSQAPSRPYQRAGCVVHFVCLLTRQRNAITTSYSPQLY